jgi:hypothetical protein
MFTGLNKTTQKTWTLQEENSMEKEEMYFSANDKNAIALKYFDLRTSAL